MTRPIADELGGAAGLTATVADLYQRLLGDPEVAPYFAGVQLGPLRRHMVDFLLAALDGPEGYASHELAEAHRDLGITSDAFDAMACHLLDSLEHRSVRPELLDSVLERIAPLRPWVVTRESDGSGDDSPFPLERPQV